MNGVGPLQVNDSQICLRDMSASEGLRRAFVMQKKPRSNDKPAMRCANRNFSPGLVWHITHRCSQREFLVRFACDRLPAYRAHFDSENVPLGTDNSVYSDFNVGASDA